MDRVTTEKIIDFELPKHTRWKNLVLSGELNSSSPHTWSCRPEVDTPVGRLHVSVVRTLS